MRDSLKQLLAELIEGFWKMLLMTVFISVSAGVIGGLLILIIRILLKNIFNICN